MRRCLLLLFLLSACTDTPDAEVQTDLVDTTDSAETDSTDAAVDTDSADIDSVDTTDSAADTPLEPITPEESELEMDWALQSRHSPESWFGWPVATELEDGSLLLAGLANGVVELGEHRVDTSTDDPYAHGVSARITPAGQVVDLRRLCVRCLSGSSPILALPDDRFALASAVDGEVVLAPGARSERTVQATNQLLVAIFGADGELERHALVARFGQGKEVTALAPTPNGGFAIGGAADALSIDSGPSFVGDEGWHYPGRAFLVVVDADLRPRYAELLGGDAGSIITMLHVMGDALHAVGDFGGYPLGVSAIFNKDLESAVTLESVSSDDDPAMDLFVARFTLPSLAAESPPTRPGIAWARRIAHYQNGPRQPTWLRATDTGVEFRVDRADTLETDGEHYALPRPDDHWTSAVLRVSTDGLVTRTFAANGPVVPLPDGGYLSVASAWSGVTYRPAGDEGPSFSVPPSTTGVDGLDHQGHVLARWRRDGALLVAGQLIASTSSSYSRPTLQHLVPQPDGSALLVFHGSAPVTLVPSRGEPLELAREPNYERIIVLRARLAPQ